MSTVYAALPEPITLVQLHGASKEQYIKLLELQLNVHQRLIESGFHPISPEEKDKWDTNLHRLRSDRDLIWTEISPDLHNTVHSVIPPGLMDTKEQKVLRPAVARRRMYDPSKFKA